MLDNSTLGSTPIKTHLEPGSYRLRLTLKGHTDLEVNLIVPETGEVNAVFSLQSKVQMAAISVWCNIRRVKVAIDGKVVAMTPLSGSIQVAPGRHQIALTREGYGLIEEFVEVPENREMHLRYTLYPIATTRTWRTVVGWPALIGGLVGIGAGVFSMTRANTYFTGSPDFDRWQGYQNLGYGAGGGLTGIGFGLLLWDAVRVNVPEEDLVGGRQFQPGRTLRPLRPETRSRR